MISSNSLFFGGTCTVLILTLNIVTSMSIPVLVPDDGQNSPQHGCKRRHFYHNDTQQCYKERTKGPCNGNMLFLKFDKVYGDCDCTEDEQLPWVYHQATNNCYEAYKQSYCPPGQWQIFDNSRKPICAPDICDAHHASGMDMENPTVLFKNKCVTLNKSSDLCAPLEEVGIRSNDVLPECIPTIAEQSVIGTNELKCRPGTRRDSIGICRRTITIQQR